MSEPIYKVGDVLEDIQTGDKFLIIFTEIEGLSQREYEVVCYDTHKAFLFNWLSESFLIKKTKRLGNIDISLLLDGEPKKKWKLTDGKWKLTDEDLPDIIDSLEKAGMEVKMATDAVIDGLKVKCVGVDDDGVHITCTKEDIEQAQEVEKAWDKAADIFGHDKLHNDAEEVVKWLKHCIDPNTSCVDCPYNKECNAGGLMQMGDALMKEAVRVFSLILEEKPINNPTANKTDPSETNDICDEYDALAAEVKKLTEELKFANEAYNRQTICHEAWKQGWIECLKTFKYYLGTDDDKDDWC